MAKIKRDPAVTMTGVHATQIYDIVDQLLERNGLEDEPVRVNLARCVCCGGGACRARHVETDMHRIECVVSEICGARTGFYSTEAEAIAAWNRRA